MWRSIWIENRAVIQADDEWWKEVEAESRDNNKSKQRTFKVESFDKEIACFEITFGMRRQ